MPDDLEESSSKTFNIQSCLDVVRRRHLHFLIPLFFGWLAVWSVSWVLPPRYRSGTLILVEQPTMPKNYVMPNIADDLQERLQSISQQILSRTRLLHIIDDLNLYSSPKGVGSPDDKVEHMRKDIEIELVHDSSDRVTAFNVYYSSRDPHTAQRVTSELTNLFISENLEIRQQQSEGTTRFLEDQLETARNNLAEQEEKMRAFKSQHVGELPSQLGSNLQILNGLQSQMQTEADALNAAKQHRVYLQTLIDQYRTLQTSPKSADGVPVGLPALDEELGKLKEQLADLSSRYTDRHPDVRKLKEQIAKTEKMREQISADLKTKTSGAQNKADSEAAPEITIDTNGMTSPMAQIQGQLHANEIEINNRERALADLNSRIADYQARLNQEPVREQQLADLSRGYDQSKTNYDELLKKKNDSAMATSMELRQQGERFRILDPPSLPVKADFPKHLKMCEVGLGVGLALGFVLAGAFEMLDHRIYDEKELKSLLPVKVLVEIPEVSTFLDEKRARNRLWLGWGTAAIILSTILAGTAVSYLRG